jgi:hypothetical protein
MLRPTGWVSIILDGRGGIVQSNSTVNLLSDDDLLGLSLTKVGARVAHCNIWVTRSLSLANLESEW